MLKRTIATLAVASSALTTPTQAQDAARLTSIQLDPSSPVGLLQIRVNGKAMGMCNFARVNIDQIEYSATAKHCLPEVPVGQGEYDVVTVENLTRYYASK